MKTSEAAHAVATKIIECIGASMMKYRGSLPTMEIRESIARETVIAVASSMPEFADPEDQLDLAREIIGRLGIPRRSVSVCPAGLDADLRDVRLCVQRHR